MKNSFLLFCARYIFSFVFLISFVTESIAASDQREITQYFATQSNDLLILKNKFGSIIIKEGNPDMVQIDVCVKVSAGTPAEVTKILNKIKVNMIQSSKKIDVETIFSGISLHQNKKIRIDFTVNIPSDINLDLSQKFGDIMLPELFKGQGRYNIEFGSIKGGTHEGPIELNMNNSKGEFAITSKVVANLDFSNVKFNIIREYLVAKKISHSTLAINHLYKGFAQVAAQDVSFSNLSIGIDSKANYRLNLQSSFGALNIAPDITMISEKRNEKNNITTITGEVKAGTGKGLINYKGSFSNLNIKNI